MIRYLLIYLLLLISTTCMPDIVRAESDVCFTQEDSVDIITLLDASDRDIILLESCHKLVENLQRAIETRDKKIVSLTDELIHANQQVIKYKGKYKQARKLLWYSTAVNIILVLIKIAPAL